MEIETKCSTSVCSACDGTFCTNHSDVGCETKNSDMFNTEDGDVCENCYRDYSYCCDCGDMVKDMYSSDVCQRCFDANWSVCNDCGDAFTVDDLNDDGYCSSCASDREEDDGRWYREYSHKPVTQTSLFITSKRAFGVEIEFIDNDDERNAISSAIPKTAGMCEDGSLNSGGVEIQTPPLIQGEQYIRDVCDAIKSRGGEVDNSCGLHVHLDCEDIFTQDDYEKPYTISRLLQLYMSIEPVLHAMLPSSRRTNRFCIALSELYHMREVQNASNLEALEMLWYREQSRENKERRKKGKYDDSRYAGINFHSLFGNHHLEIRYHSGTVNADKILHWTKLHQAVIDYAVKHGQSSAELIHALRSKVEISDKFEILFDALIKHELIGNDTKDYIAKRIAKFSRTTSKEEALTDKETSTCAV